MTVQRNITKEDIFLKARMLSEGVRVKLKKPPERGSPYRPVVLEGCDLVVQPLPNPYSRLEVVIDGEDVTISDMGKVLSLAKLEVRRSWLDEPMSNGAPVEHGFTASASSISIINIIMNFRCYNYDSGQGCRYCGLFAFPKSRAPPPSMVHKYTSYHVETAIIAAQNGWRGTLSITGGAYPPSQKGQNFKDLERVMSQLHDSLDDKTLNELHIAPNVYPPDDLEEMYKWKDLGVNAAEYDLEVMDPAYFKAICPGKSKSIPQERWKEAQEVATELEERISKGVYSAPLVMVPTPGSPYEKFRPPTADWFVEASEKIADIYFQYANTLDVNLLTDNRAGFTRVGLSYPHILVRDEMMRRLQEQGKFPPGLPSQDFIE
ncbi:MAG: radical SAM protein [Promethearchaeota archaeon]|jgi:hypothetical protein